MIYVGALNVSRLLRTFSRADPAGSPHLSEVLLVLGHDSAGRTSAIGPANACTRCHGLENLGQDGTPLVFARLAPALERFVGVVDRLLRVLHGHLGQGTEHLAISRVCTVPESGLFLVTQVGQVETEGIDSDSLVTSKVPSLPPAVHCPLMNPPFSIHRDGFCSCRRQWPVRREIVIMMTSISERERRAP